MASLLTSSFRFLLVVIVLCTVLPSGRAAAQSQSQIAESWWRNALTLNSRYYDVRTDLPPDSARMVVEHMDRMCDAYRDVLSTFRINRHFRLQMLVFASEDTYLSVLAHKFDANGAGSAGVCISRHSQITLAAWVIDHNDPSQLLATLRHEGFHQFANSMFRAIPPWANEGLAEIFEHGIVIGDQVILGEVSPHWHSMLSAASKQRALKKFDEFMSMDGAEWNGQIQSGTAGLNYAQAWALVHFFLYAENARFQKGFVQFLSHMNQGDSWGNAFMKAFGTRNYESLQTKFLEHIETIRPTDFLLTLQRLEFLAEGTIALVERGIYPVTLEEMRTELQKIGFEHKIGRGLDQMTILATDPASFLIPRSQRVEAAVFDLLPPPEEPKKGRQGTTRKPQRKGKSLPLPARIVTSGLMPRTFGVDWKRDRKGRLSYSLVTD